MDKYYGNRFESFLKKHLVRVNKNLYISPSDPHFYDKYLRFIDKQSPEAHFKLGENHEAEGNIRKAMYHYSMATKTYSPFYYIATKKLSNLNNNLLLHFPDSSKKSNKPLTLLLTIVLILLLIMFMLFLFNSPYNQSNEDGLNSAASEDLTSIPTLSDLPEDVLPLHFIGANFIRTALDYYIRQHGSPPSTITALAGDYPNNYVTFIPVEIASESNSVVTNYDGSGGWVYDANAASLETMFYPNIPLFQDSTLLVSALPFEPMTIVVNKKDYTLFVTTGPYTLKTVNVGLGRDNRTPETSLTIIERVINPKGNSGNIYGKAGLALGQMGELGELALHGTQDLTSILADKSLGCIRLSNEDIVAIYPLIPIGSMVNITNTPSQESTMGVFEDMKRLFPSSNQTAKETTDRVFNWLG